MPSDLQQQQQVNPLTGGVQHGSVQGFQNQQPGGMFGNVLGGLLGQAGGKKRATKKAAAKPKKPTKKGGDEKQQQQDGGKKKKPKAKPKRATSPKKK